MLFSLFNTNNNGTHVQNPYGNSLVLQVFYQKWTDELQYHNNYKGSDYVRKYSNVNDCSLYRNSMCDFELFCAQLISVYHTQNNRFANHAFCTESMHVFPIKGAKSRGPNPINDRE